MSENNKKCHNFQESGMTSLYIPRFAKHHLKKSMVLSLFFYDIICLILHDQKWLRVYNKTTWSTAMLKSTAIFEAVLWHNSTFSSAT